MPVFYRIANCSISSLHELDIELLYNTAFHGFEKHAYPVVNIAPIRSILQALRLSSHLFNSLAYEENSYTAPHNNIVRAFYLLLHSIPPTLVLKELL